jgi:hypothetical protein
VLLQNLNEYMSLQDPSRQWKEEEIVVRVYVNANGLKRTLRRHQPQYDLQKFDELVRRFGSLKANWQIIDVGEGSQAADNRIRGRRSREDIRKISLTFSIRRLASPCP